MQPGAGVGVGGPGTGPGAGGGDGGGVGDGVGDPGKGCGPGAWLMRTTWPAIVAVLLRARPVFGLTSNRTDALDWPVAGFAAPIQSASPRAVQAHPSSVVSVMEIASPVAATSRVVGDTV